MTTLTGNLTSQTLTGSGGWTATGTTTIGTGVNLMLTQGAVLTNQGTLTVSGTVTGGDASTVAVNNTAGATLNLNSGTIFGLVASGTETLNNSGAITVSGTSQMSQGLVNLGTGSVVLASGASLTIGGLAANYGSSSNAAAFSGTASSSLTFESDFTFSGGAYSFAGTTTIGVNETLHTSGSTTIASAIKDFGTIEVASGTLTIAHGGDISGNSSAANAPKAILIDDGATLNVAGTVETSQTVNFAGAHGTLVLASPATFNATIGTLAVGDVIDLTGMQATSATSNGNNQLVVSNNGTTVATYYLQSNQTYSFTETADGSGGTDLTVSAIGPAGSKLGTGTVNSLTGSIAAQTLAGPGTWNATGATTLAAATTLILSRGAVLSNQGTMTVSGTVTGGDASTVAVNNAAGATLNLNSGTIFGLVASGTETLNNSGAITVSGTSQISQGLVNLGSGSVVLASGASLTIGGLAANYGSSSNAAAFSGTAPSSLTFESDFTFTGGTYSFAGTTTIGVNETLHISGSTTIASAIKDFGTIEVASGKLTIAQGGDISGNSSAANAKAILIDDGATLNVAGTVETSQTVNFAGAHGTLVLASPPTFNATIGTLAVGDVIDLAGTQATSATSNGNNQLVVSNNGTTVATYYLQSNLTYSFTETADGSGGTDLTVSAIGPAGSNSTGTGTVNSLTGSIAAQTLVGPGTWNATGATTLAAATTLILSRGAVLSNQGTMTVSGTVTGGDASTVAVNNAAGATLNLNSGTIFGFVASGTETLDNSGVINVSGISQMSQGLVNLGSGSVVLASGASLTIGGLAANYGSSSNAAAFSGTASSSLTFESDFTFTGGTYSFAGTTTIGVNETLHTSGSTTIASAIKDFGTIEVASGTLTIARAETSRATVPLPTRPRPFSSMTVPR